MTNTQHLESSTTYDVIVVLGGGIKENGSLTATSRQRVEYALGIQKDRNLPIIMSGKWSLFTINKPPLSEARAMHDYALTFGTAEDKILLEEESMETIGNAYFTRLRYLEPKHWHRIIIVTSDFHSERTSRVFERVLSPSYVFDVALVPGTLSKDEIAIKIAREKKSTALMEHFMANIKEGDMTPIGNFLDMLPGYSPNPKYSRENLLKLIESGKPT